MSPNTRPSPFCTSGALPKTSQYQPKVYLHKMSARIEANHTLDNLCLRQKVSRPQNIPGQPSVKTLRRSTQWATIAAGSGRRLSTTKEGPEVPPWERDFRTMKTQLLKHLKQVLAKTKAYSIHETDHDEKGGKNEPAFRLPSEEVMTRVRSIDLYSLSQAEFVGLCTDKQLSKGLQAAIVRGPPPELPPLLGQVKACLGQLISEELGSYVIQHAVARSTDVVDHASSFCSGRLSSLSRDRAAARVLLRLADESQAFRMSVITWFTSQADGLFCDPAAALLTASALRAAESLAEVSIFAPLLESPAAATWLSNKEFRKVVAAFVEKCDRADLDRAAKHLKVAKRLINYLDDKQGATIVLSLVEREHRATERAILREINSNLSALFKARYFKFFFFKVVRGQSNWTLVREMQSSLLSLPRDVLETALDSPEAEYFYCGLLATICEPGSKPLLKSLVRSISWPSTLRQTLIGLQSYSSFHRIPN